MSTYCLGSSAPAAYFVPPCDGPVAAWVAVMSVLTFVRACLCISATRYWTARRARQLKFAWHGGDPAKIARVRTRKPVVPVVFLLTTLVYGAFTGVPFWIAEPQERDRVMLALMGALSILFYFAAMVSIKHFVKLGERLIGVSELVLSGSQSSEFARKFERLRSVDGILRGAYALIVVLIALIAAATLPFNLAVPAGADRSAAFALFYASCVAASALVIVAMQHQLYRIDVAVRSAQRLAAPGLQSTAIYARVRQRLWHQRAGIAATGCPAPLVYALAAAGAIPNLYLFLMLISVVETLVNFLTLVLFRPVRRRDATASASSKSDAPAAEPPVVSLTPGSLTLSSEAQL